MQLNLEGFKNSSQCFLSSLHCPFASHHLHHSLFFLLHQMWPQKWTQKWVMEASRSPAIGSHFWPRQLNDERNRRKGVAGEAMKVDPALWRDRQRRSLHSQQEFQNFFRTWSLQKEKHPGGPTTPEGPRKGSAERKTTGNRGEEYQISKGVLRGK